MNHPISLRSAPRRMKGSRDLAVLAPWRIIAVLFLATTMSFVGLIVGPPTGAGATTLNETQVVNSVGSPEGIAFDSAGDLFMVNNSDNSVIVVPATSGTIFGQAVTANIPVKLDAATGLDGPNTLAFDAEGNLYISNWNGTNSVTVIPAATGTLYGQPVTADTPITLITELNRPAGIAFDGSSLLVVSRGLTASNIAGTVTVIPSTGVTSLFGQSVTPDAVSNLTISGLNVPNGIAVNQGNLYIANSLNTSTGENNEYANTVMYLPANGGSPSVILNGLSEPAGITFDAAGDLFVAESEDAGVTVLPASGVTSLFGQTVPGTLMPDVASPDGLAMYGGNLYVTSDTNSPNAAVDVLSDVGGTLFGQAVSADTVTALNVSTMVDQPEGLAVDAAGDLFIANYFNNTITVIAKQSGTIFGQSVMAGVPSILTESGPSLSKPTSLAFDAAGDLFVTNSGSNSITVIPASSTTTTIFGQSVPANEAATLTTDGLSLNAPSGIAFDAAGDLFISNRGNNSITVISASTTTIFGQSVNANEAAPLTTDGLSLNTPIGIAFDSVGDLFIANNGTDGTGGSVTVLPAPGVTSIFGQTVTPDVPTTLTEGSGLATPTALAFDSAGDLFVADNGTNADTDDGTVSVIPAIATTSAIGESDPQGSATTLITSLFDPMGLVVNGNNLYASDLGGVVVDSASVAPPTSVSTPPTSVSTPPTTSPALPPASATVPASVFGTPSTVAASSVTPTTVTSTSGSASETINVPAGALPSGTNVSVYPITNTAPIVAQVPNGSSYVYSFAVSWETPSDTSPIANTPLSVTITDPGMVAGDTVFQVTPTGLVADATTSTDGTVNLTFSGDPIFVITHALAIAPAVPHATRVNGFAVVGKTVTLSVVGSHFYGQPKITSSEEGTRAVVAHDSGTLLSLRVTVSRSARSGVHTLTIRLADGASCTVRYLLK